MKIFVFASSAMFLCSVSSLAHSQVRLPKKLICTNIGSCVAGFENFCEGSTYFSSPVVIENAQEFVGRPSDPSGTLSEAELAGKIQINFGESDQERFYRFSIDDINAVNSGTLLKLKGTFEDGFYWTNGYNVRARFNIECTAQRD